jgi:predicted lipoprotein with Yx(FWY)xxD motif
VLYVNNVDRLTRIQCASACLAVWKPVEVAGDAVPAKLPGINGTFTVVKRPGGVKQLALTGHPLYTFTKDTKPKSASGNMSTDAFGGRHFSWHVATATGAMPTHSPSPSPSKGYN